MRQPLSHFHILLSLEAAPARIIAGACDRRLLHDHKAGPLEMPHDPIGSYRSHVFIRVVDPLPA
jgi:hypothetical protein